MIVAKRRRKPNGARSRKVFLASAYYNQSLPSTNKPSPTRYGAPGRSVISMTKSKAKTIRESLDN